MARKPFKKILNRLADVRLLDSKGNFAVKKIADKSIFRPVPIRKSVRAIKHQHNYVVRSKNNYHRFENDKYAEHRLGRKSYGTGGKIFYENKKASHLMILDQAFDSKTIPYVNESGIKRKMVFRDNPIMEFEKHNGLQYENEIFNDDIRIIEGKSLKQKIAKKIINIRRILGVPFTFFADIAFASTVKVKSLLKTRKRHINEPKYQNNYYHEKIGLRPVVLFVSFSLMIIVVFGSFNFISRGLLLKEQLKDQGWIAYENLAQANEGISNKNLPKTILELNEANRNFQEMSKEISSFGGIFVDISSYIPFMSKLSSGKALSQAGSDLTHAGILIVQAANNLDKITNPLSKNNDESISLLKIFQETEASLKEAHPLLESANVKLGKVQLKDLPEEQRGQFVSIREKLPKMNKYLENFLEQSYILKDFLGGNGPRKYLFLFQNNQEMRATGGFIGSYGILNISQGRIKSFAIDGIFNPDGQLKEKVVPPVPLQKVSATWSLHDSNWFPDFPVSAEKSAWFYEKSGGPTVDGVITMTPEVLKKMLNITGPIEMPDYGKVITSDNFIEEVQSEVEVDYEKQLNQPKRIIGDLAPIIIDRIFNSKDYEEMARTIQVLVDSLNQKHILIYSMNHEIEKSISQIGWSGEILKAQKDYISVINSNINGYKTDGVIDEKVKMNSEIANDGSVINTLTITRQHNGGNSNYEWYNKVNADYMRVYVPKGSRLISAEGQTREFNSPPINYQALGFKVDPQLSMEEQEITIDEDSGTRIYEDSDKTVFANWIYVSPQETASITYKYILPFKVQLDDPGVISESYSIIFQKQSGSLGDDLEFNMTFPKTYNPIWKYPEMEKATHNSEKNQLSYKSTLDVDRFVGMAFVKE